MSTIAHSSRNKSKRRIFIVEDHPVTREGFAQLLNYQADLQVCGQADTVAKARVGIATSKPDLVIVDIALGNTNGLELIKDIKTLHPSLPVLVLSTYDEALYAERSLRAGARGYVMKQAPTSEVMEAIRRVLAGNLHLSEAARARFVHKHLHDDIPHGGSELDALTDRELEVFRRIGAGCTTRQIAQEMHLSVSTVETYRAHIKEKLGLENAAELIRCAVEWTDLPPR